MASEDSVKMNGTVIEVLPSTTFRVSVNDNHQVLCTLGGRLRKAKIRIILGDNVEIECSPYDLNRGRITFRNK